MITSNCLQKKKYPLSGDKQMSPGSSFSFTDKTSLHPSRLSQLNNFNSEPLNSISRDLSFKGSPIKGGSDPKNILKIAEEELAKHPKRQLYVLGEVGRHYFEERGIEINKQFHYTIQNPTLNRARNISEELLEDYRQGDFDEIYIIYTSMVNAMQEEAEILQLLPLKKADFHNVEIPLDVRREELALRPSADAVMNRIVPDYVVGFVYGALVESFSCEQNARMMAMEAATNSAKDMLHELDIMYNRARQAAITQEITEVIAGAKSQKRKKKR
jgi:F-type H+-transporting ATPase subunit gamma